MHGAGIIEEIETRTINDVDQQYYVVSLFLGNIKIMVPVAKEATQIRTVTQRDHAKQILDALHNLETEQNKRYIMYYLRSMAYSDVFLALSTGIRVRSCDLRWNKLAELLYAVPPIEKQNAIVKHIDNLLEKSNAVIDAKKKEIETLEAYKKSLIYEYVTGKKEVPA